MRAGSKRSLTRAITASAPGSGAAQASARSSGGASSSVQARGASASRAAGDRPPGSSASQNSPRPARPTTRAPVRQTAGRSVDPAGDLQHAGAALVDALRHPQLVVVLDDGALLEPERRAIRATVAAAWSAAAALPKRTSSRPAPSRQSTSRQSASSGCAASAVAAAPSTSGSSLAPIAVAVRGGSGCSRTATRTISPSVPSEPVNSLRQVVARDVLDHLAAGACASVPSRQRDGRADDEVAHAAVAVAQRAGVGRRP